MSTATASPCDIDGREPSADERDRLERRLLAKALAVILSADWGNCDGLPNSELGNGPKVEPPCSK